MDQPGTVWNAQATLPKDTKAVNLWHSQRVFLTLLAPSLVFWSGAVCSFAPISALASYRAKSPDVSDVFCFISLPQNLSSGLHLSYREKT